MSGWFQHAEGWRRRLPYGFCAVHSDPLRDVMGADYARSDAGAMTVPTLVNGEAPAAARNRAAGRNR